VSGHAAALREKASTATRAALDEIPDLDRQLDAFVRAAATTDFEVSPIALLTWLGGQLAPDDAPRIPSFSARDLALAFACLNKDPIAQALFVERYGPLMRRVASRLIDANRIDDLLQIVTARLLIGAEQPPRIGQYRGRCELGGWVRVVTTREALSMLRKEPNPTGDNLESLAEAITDLAAGPEIELLRKTYARQFASAFQAALLALTPRQRNLLRYSLVEKLSIDVIGELYGVHRSTVARWIEAARAALSEDTKTRLAAQLDLGPEALDSLLRFVLSAVDVSIDRLLAATPDEPD
jgi:RNA polymerase sigma-70 factor